MPVDIFISYRLIEQTNIAAADLLRLCAFLHPDAIPVELILRYGLKVDPILQTLVGDDEAFATAIDELSKYDLICYDANAQTLSIPLPVVTMLMESMTRGEQRQWSIYVVQLLSQAFQDEEFSTWPRCERYLPHVRHGASLIVRWQLYTVETARLLNRAGLCLQEYGYYAEVEEFYQLALQIFEQVLGSIHIDTANCLQNIAELSHRQGRDELALTLSKRVIAIYELTLGLEHPRMIYMVMHYVLLLQQKVARMQMRLNTMRTRLCGSLIEEG